MNEPFRSRVYTERPPYADFEAPAKFEAIKSIIAKRLIEHPNAVCSYSGGSDSDIMLHLIEQVRAIFNLPPVHYAFFNTGLEMKAIKQHVKDMEKHYGVTITEYRPKKNIVLATHEEIKLNGKSPYTKKMIGHVDIGNFEKHLSLTCCQKQMKMTSFMRW